MSDFHGAFECRDITEVLQAIHTVSPYAAGLMESSKSLGCGMWHFDFQLDPYVALLVIRAMMPHVTSLAGKRGAEEVFVIRDGELHQYQLTPKGKA